jgi:hypothetical protein
VARLAPPPAPEAEPRAVIDRRGQGFAGTVGDVISSGESVLVVCADTARRRAAIEELVGGLAAALRGEAEIFSSQLALVSWTALERAPELARPYAHLVALDPPESERAETLLATAASSEPAARGHAWLGRGGDRVRGARGDRSARPAPGPQGALPRPAGVRAAGRCGA